MALHTGTPTIPLESARSFDSPRTTHLGSEPSSATCTLDTPARAHQRYKRGDAHGVG